MRIEGLVVAAGSLVVFLAASPGIEHVPQFDLAATCRGSAPGTGGAASPCRTDEATARRQLESQWATIPASVRQSCLTEVNIGGSPSYVELLTCAQMDKWSKEEPNPTAPGQVRRDGSRP